MPSTLYPPLFIPGTAGYWAYELQGTGPAVAIDATVDPTAIVCSSVAGLGPIPGQEQVDSLRAVESAGAYQDLGEIGGLRTYTIPVNMMLLDGTFLGLAIRGTIGTGNVLGLPLFALEYGALSGVPRAAAYNALDCLINTARLSFRPNAFVSVDIEAWPSVVVPALPQNLAYSSLGDPLRWENSAMVNGSYDYRAQITSVDLMISNNLERSPGRNRVPLTGPEVAISRTAYSIYPKMQKLQLTVSGQWDTDSSLDSPADWGTTIISATNGSGTLALMIDHAVIDRKTIRPTSTNETRQFSAQVNAFGITSTWTPAV